MGRVAAGRDVPFDGQRRDVYRANNGFGNQQPLALAGRGNAVLCGTNSGVYRTTDNGANWALSSTGLPASAIVFALYASGDTLFAGVAGQGVYRSTNDGASWTPSNSGMAGVSVLALAQFGATLYAGANSQGVYVSTNGGSNWTQVNNGIPGNARNITAFAGAGSTVYAATFVQSGLYGTTDNGANWAQAATGLPTTTNSVLNGIAAVGNILFVNPLQGSLYRATHPSLTWTAVTGTNAPTNVYTLIASGNYLYAGDQTGNVYVTSVQ